MWVKKPRCNITPRIRTRAIGTALSGKITRQFGMKGLQPGHATVRLRGSAGQSLGAFAVQGLKLEVFGDANDYVGKGLSGGTIVVRPLTASPLKTNENTIIGNTRAVWRHRRQAVRGRSAPVNGSRCAIPAPPWLSKAAAPTVVKYMTGGLAVILGKVGDNFGAGMTGGMAYVYDEEGSFPLCVNPESVIWQRLEVPYYEEQLKALIEEHIEETGSRWAAQLLNDWDLVRGQFWQVVPKEMLSRLPIPVTAPERLSAE